MSQCQTSPSPIELDAYGDMHVATLMSEVATPTIAGHEGLFSYG